MRPEDLFNAWSNHTSTPYTNSNYFYADSPRVKPYKWPEQPDTYPQLQEGDRGKIIIRQASIDWRNRAIDDLVRQLQEREKQIGCQMEMIGSLLPDGSMLVEWYRLACEGVHGGPK